MQPAPPGSRLVLGALRRSLPRAGCEAGVTSTSRGGQAGRSARARLAGRGSGRGAGEHARARTPGQPGRPLLPVTAVALLLVVPLKAAEAAAAPDTCGGDPPAARRCGPWRRRYCWAPAAAVSGSGIPALGLVRSTQAPPQECGLHPRRPGGARRRAEKRGEGWRDARALRTRSATVGGPGGARAPLPSSLCSPSLVPFPPGESGLKLLTLQCAHVGRLGTTATVQTRTAKKARGQLPGTPPPRTPLLSQIFHAAFGVEGLEWEDRASCDEVRILVKSTRKAFCPTA